MLVKLGRIPSDKGTLLKEIAASAFIAFFNRNPILLIISWLAGGIFFKLIYCFSA
jgi:hypothetical protein